MYFVRIPDPPIAQLVYIGTLLPTETDDTYRIYYWNSGHSVCIQHGVMWYMSPNGRITDWMRAVFPTMCCDDLHFQQCRWSDFVGADAPFCAYIGACTETASAPGGEL